LCLLPTSGLASDLPELVFPQGVGVNIHFTRGHERDLDLIAAAGFKFIRMDFGWAGIERKPGDYDWSAYDTLTSNLDQRGLRALYILDYSNPLYEEAVVSRDPIGGRERRDTASPQRPESVAAFAKWAGEAAQRYRGRRIIWEIWNEPNIGFWKPKPDVRQYTALALATCQAIRAADPQATIIAPATSGFPWQFLEDFFAAGALAHLDAVSVHPYRNYSQGPETAVADYAKLRALIQRHAPPGKQNLPIISGEWGYASHTKGGVSLDTQAAFLARQQLVNVWQGVPLSIWYDWKNDGSNREYNEDNFGTVTEALQPKPAYHAVQTLTRQLTGCRVARRLSTANDKDYLLLCLSSGGVQKVAAWTLDSPHSVAIDLGVKSADEVTAVSSSGQNQPVQVADGKLRVDLGAAPQYITLKQPAGKAPQ
jgi:hypothetical protein